MANPQPDSSLAHLILTLGAEKIRFLIVGMAAAVIQGAPVVTFDTDIWLDLRVRILLKQLLACKTKLNKK